MDDLCCGMCHSKTMIVGQMVWFDGGVGFPVPGEVVHSAGKVMQVKSSLDGRVHKIKDPNSLRIRYDSVESGIDDMIQLRDLHEGALLVNLKTRYEKKQIYTYTGSILVAVNPYRMFDIYGIEMVKKYEGQLIGHLPPHLFAIGSAAYARMSKNNENQVVVISGESGAGKTESTKLIMQYLAAVNKSSNNIITEQILEANPLLESFGNAKTIRNDNSSRFGKYIEVFFSGGIITGAATTDYLLEKSRIVHQTPEERNYHVFYEMLAGLSPQERAKYGLHSADKYNYLNQGGSVRIEHKKDSEDFIRLVSAMEVLGFHPNEQETIFGILASVLHLGNVQLVYPKSGHETLIIENQSEIKLAAKFLQLPQESLERSVTYRLTETRDERILTPLTYEQAIDARDAIAKALYARLFSWLVERVNSIVSRGQRITSIAILDIFGFEVFRWNSFEQLCINYANETLQYYFNKHIFKLEQQEYTREKIHWKFISYTDNQPCLDLISKRPIGIIHLLDDESSFPKASDQSFLDKANQQHAKNIYYIKPKMPGPEFGIKHYAGPVLYQVTRFLDKNRDHLRSDVVDMLIESHSPMVAQMFKSHRQYEMARTYSRATGSTNTLKRMRASTVATKFHDSLSELIEAMSQCNPFFVRCIKPNNDKAPMLFEPPLVLEQLRYSGMLETIRIRKMGYPIRLNFITFANRYRCLIGPTSFHTRSHPKEICQTIMNRMGSKYEKQYQLGSTKVFLREALEADLEYERSILLKHATIIIQKYVRAYLARKHYLQMQKSAVTIQSYTRKMIERRRYKKMRQGYIKLQALYKAKRQRQAYLRFLEENRRREEERKRRAATAKATTTTTTTTTSVDAHQPIKPILRKHSGVAHLEVPYELAFIFSKIDEWTPVHSERNVVKVVGKVARQDYQYALPPDINAHPFSKYANIYFKTKTFGMMYQPIDTGFLKLNDVDDKEAVALFKMIQRYMADLNINKDREVALGNFIAQKGLQNGALRDEIYSQLCNQTWQNDRNEENERAWILMSNCLSVFPPSPKMYKYLLKYVSDHAYDGWKIHCQHKLLSCDTINSGLTRTYPPCMLELKANRQRNNMALSARYPDGEEVMGEVDSWTTGEEFAAALLKNRGVLQGNKGWSVWMKDENERYELAGYDYVLDLIGEMEVPPDFPVLESQFLVSSEIAREGPPQRKMTLAPNQMPDIEKLLENEEIAARHNVKPTSVVTHRVMVHQNSAANRAPEQPQYLIPEPDYEGVDFEKLKSLPTSSGYVMNGMVDPSGQPFPERDYFNTRLAPIQEASPPRSRAHKRRSRSDSVGSDKSDRSDRSDTKSAVSKASEVTLGTKIRMVPVPSVNSPSDMDEYLDRLFDPVISANMEPLTNANAMDKKLKGGGRGPPGSSSTGSSGYRRFPMTSIRQGSTLTNGTPSVPIVQIQQPVMQQPMMVPAQQPMMVPAQQPMMVPAQQPMMVPAQQPMMVPAYDPQQVYQQQQQSMLAQQAYLNQQTILAQQVQMQQQREMLENLQKQNASTVAPTATRVTTATSPMHKRTAVTKMASKFESNSLSQPSTSTTSAMNGPVSSSTTSAPEASAGPPVPNGIPDSPPPPPPPPPPLPDRSAQTETKSADAVTVVKITRTATKATHQSEPPESSSVPPPPPPPDTSSKGLAPPPPPPPVPPPQKSVIAPTVIKLKVRDGEKNFASRAKTVRVGKVVWPPKPKEVEKHVTEVHRLQVEIEGEGGSQGSNRTPGKLNIEERPTSEIKSIMKTAHRKEQDVRAETLELIKQRGGKPISTEEKKTQPVRPSSLMYKSEIQVKVEQNSTAEKKTVIPPPPPPQSKTLIEETKVSRQTSFRKPEDSHAQALAILKKKKTTEVTKETKSTVPPPPPPPPPPTTTTSTKKVAEELDYNIDDYDDEERIHKEALEKLQLQKDAVHNEALEKVRLQQEKTHREALSILNRRKSVQFSPESSLEPNSEDNENEEIVPPVPVKTHAAYQEQISRTLSQAEVEKLERVKTELFPSSQAAFLAYTRVRWQLILRKEVFTPSEKLENPTLLHLIFCQVVQDVLGNSCIRISKEEKRRMREVLDELGITLNNMSHKTQTKKQIIEAARQWPCYFCRLFPVSGGRKNPQVEYVGVCDKGIRLMRRQKEAGNDQLVLMDSFSFNEIQELRVSQRGTLRIILTNQSVISLYTFRAFQIKEMVDAYIIDLEKDSQYVRAIADYITRESTLLSFRRGDFIKLTAKQDNIENGWLYGMLDGRTGSFPSEYVTAAPGPDAYRHTKIGNRMPEKVLVVKKTGQVQDNNRDDTSNTQLDGKYSMMEFAMKYFRESLEKYEMQRKADGSISGSLRFIGTLKSSLKGGTKKRKDDSWTWQEYANMVKYNKSPIPASLLRLESGHLNKMALECFIAVMRLMGDYPMKGKTELDCVYYILKSCHENEQLIDEVYCHLCKQTTSNKSPKVDSCPRGWRFFAIFTSYFQCSPLLKPYLVKYLQTAANDNQRQFHGTAAVCLYNLRKTFKYGGRKNIPCALEVKALLAGRNQKRQQYILPGGIRTMLKTKTCTVAVDVVEELCYEMGVHKQVAIEEYGIFAVVEKENLVLPLNPGDYIIDVTTQLERQNYDHYLIFKKVLWHQPLRLENPLNVTIIYNQVLPDYLSGRLLVMQNGVLTTEQQNEVARLAALQRKASDIVQMPTTRDLRGILPSVVINQLKAQQWVNMIHQYLPTVERQSPHECKVEFLTTLQSWPLFGSNFFHIRSISDSRIQGECIMAINKQGVHFLHSVTHEILVSNPFTEIVSTRRLKSGQGKWFIDLKYGNLMVQKVTRIETDQNVTLHVAGIINQYSKIHQDTMKQLIKIKARKSPISYHNTYTLKSPGSMSNRR
ncbi:unconventional myosin-XV-like isoform X12 [Ptychodera flava]|uniref:unconventional myosin-XV-like isoform X12 n=1 Tax=Ptychodera flava TaxID=63121 RepID=UPI003969EC4F